MVIYKFYKDDCVPCYTLSRLLVNNHLDGMVVPKNVNIEENATLAKSKGINKVPALMKEDGSFIEGVLTKDQLLEFIGG